MKKQRGFTLIEVLIVVIIIAILAGLILPRFLAQPERAYLAEAQQMLGAMRRAQITTMDSSGAAGYLLITACPVAGACTAAEWNAIGMTAPDTNANGAFDYACAAGGLTCTATRRNQGAERNTNQITLANTGTWTCGGGGGTKLYTASVPASQGCRA